MAEISNKAMPIHVAEATAHVIQQLSGITRELVLYKDGRVMNDVTKQGMFKQNIVREQGQITVRRIVRLGV